ncbi:MAG TPA: adenylate/guanylate cyclase domain-containing protein [Gaiellaceae bacterium]|nr:adenylate/guanylate cyclase domain-containing protein [Gaiellaceae bacterium]
MPVCAHCGQQTPEGFPRCANCGAVLDAPAPAREQRKTVTVLFCDLTGSTELGESLDPEPLRALLARYFERMKGIVERHGGTVEKFIGDAVMAVFGIPQAHEDDALRALRAAAEMREALPELGVAGRIGVTTGEVVAGTEERLATGDAVNVAARLEQVAAPGEVLLGEPMLALVRDAVEVEAVEPLALKGKTEPVPAFRLVAVREAPERRHDVAFVGRERERETLLEPWRRVVGEQRCELATVVGDAGVGKSRLVAELLASLDGARVVRGRCLNYGEGVGYWPVVEVLKQLDRLPEEESAAAAIRSLLGESAAPTSADELAWAFRKTLEQAAAEQPLVAVFDDIQWGEDPFLDLVEHVALFSSGVPLLLLCLARPELLERRPGWPVALRLEPLAEEAVAELLPEMLPSDLRERIVHAAGGNPLFVHEMVAIAAETEGEVTVPPTLQALLAARLDQLERPERAVLERGAVEGEIFHRGAVQALAGAEQVTPRLAALVRKQLIRPDRAQLPGDDGFRFRHLLIRDAAYDALPKATRAELHVAFARWLEEHGESLVELDEILAYHYDQAVRYREEVGLPPDPELVEVARARMYASGVRAYTQTHDHAAAARAFARAVELSGDALDVVSGIRLADALFWGGRGGEALDWSRELATRGEAVGDRRAILLARLVEGTILTFREPAGATERLEALVAEAESEFAAAGDDFGLYVAARARGQVANMQGRPDAMRRAYDDMAEHSRLAGDAEVTSGWRANGRLHGTTTVEEFLAWMETIDPAETRNLHFRGAQAHALAMAGRRDEAQAVLTAMREELRDRSDLPGLANLDIGHTMEIAELGGELDEAVTVGEAACRRIVEAGDLSVLSSYAPRLGRILCALGRLDEAEEWTKHGELGAQDDALTQVTWRQAQALIAARRGDSDAAVRLARGAVEIALTTEMLNERGDAYADLGEVLALAGDTAGAREAYECALDCYERKGNIVSAGRTRGRLAALQTA